VRVKIRGFKFKPPTLRISRGTRVVWVNRDRAPHTATRRGSFNTGVIRSGRAVAVRFKRRGTYGYICTIHPEMRGRIVVG
jgi:plastocyanin